jgi:hypothetical protein
VSKETYYKAKETYSSGKRGLFIWQKKTTSAGIREKRPIIRQKRPIHKAKETYNMAKETYNMAKEAYNMAKEAYEHWHTSGMLVLIGLFCHIKRSLLPYNRSLLTLTHTSGMPGHE